MSFSLPGDVRRSMAIQNQSHCKPADREIAAMNEIVLTPWAQPHVAARNMMNHAVKAWFVLAALGHWIFTAYILSVFYPPIMQRGTNGLQGMHLPAGFVEGDTLGNLASASHVLLAAIIIGGGPLQLIPAIRSRFPAFHRALGRTYVLTAMISAVAGLYMTWTRPGIGNLVSHLTITGDGILILICAAMTIRLAMARRIQEHRRWAMRLFMTASAVWFFRVGLMGWVILTGGIGMDFESFTGPFLYVLGFAQYALPLAMLQWYFHCQDRPSASGQWAFVGTLSVLTLFMGIGIFAATMGMWLPRM